MSKGMNINKEFRVVLVDNFWFSETRSRTGLAPVAPHLGLMSLASLLYEAGYQSEIYDPKVRFAQGGWHRPDAEFLDAWVADLLGKSAGVLGFTAYGLSLPWVIRVAERIKGVRPNQLIVLGGPHATIVGPDILKTFDCFDIVVRYEAEPTIVDLVEHIRIRKDLKDIPNLVIRQGERVECTRLLLEAPNVNDLPRPGLHFYPRSALQGAELSIEAGRGCPFSCTFCSTASFFQRRYRLKSNQRIVDEMEHVRRLYGIDRIALNHDLFGLSKPHLREFCEMIRHRQFRWSCSMRPDTLDPSIICDLAASGCTHIYCGIETGSPDLQKAIKKKLRLDDTRRTVRKIVSAGIDCTVSFITGFPEEQEHEQAETLDLLGDLLRINPSKVKPQLHLLSPEPGASIMTKDHAIRFDGLGPEIDEPVDRELIQAHPTIFSGFYHFDSVLPRWKSLFATAFVSYLLPDLGYVLATFLCSSFFGGRLSALFEAIIPPKPMDVLTFASVNEALNKGVGDLINHLGESASYLANLVNLSRMLRNDIATLPRAAELHHPDTGEIMWLARFDCDVLALAERILRNPSTVITPDMVKPKECWCLFYRDSNLQHAAVPVSRERARNLTALAKVKMHRREDSYGKAEAPEQTKRSEKHR